LRYVIPTIIKNYIPVEEYESSHHLVFELLLDHILTNGHIKDKSTQHVVLDALFTSARNEDDINLISSWLDKGFISNSKGVKLDGVELSLKHKHSIVERVWSSI
jgi:hypothetical protein